MLIWLLIIAGIIFLDQLSKYLTVMNLNLHESYTVIDGFFSFTYRQNTGAAFGIFGEADERWIHMTVSTIAIIAMFVYLCYNRKGNKLLCVALCFMVGGGIGNMIDRTFVGYVVDFLDFIIYYDKNGNPYHFATFNVADTFVCIGVALFALAVIVDEIRGARKAKAMKAYEVSTIEIAEEASVENVEENAENSIESND